MHHEKPFFIPSGPVGCLLIHGFNSGPFEMWTFGKHLAKNNITSHGILLAGHGDRPYAMKNVGGKQWFKSGKKGLMTLKKLGLKKIFISGHSLGSLVAVDLASRYKWIDGVIMTSSPAYLTHWESGILNLLNKKDGYVPFFDIFHHRKESKKIYWNHKVNEKIPIQAILNLQEYVEKISKKWKRVKAPALIIQSKRDKVIPKDSAEIIYENLGSIKKKIIWMERSSHSLLLESEKYIAYKHIVNFIKRNS